MTIQEPFSDVEDEPLLNIKAVSQATGIESVTLRAWERRYGVPMPKRTQQGYRLYSERDIAILNWLKARIDEGLTIKRAVALLQSQTPQHADLVEQAAPNPLASPPTPDDVAPGATLEELVDTLMEAVYGFDTVTAQQVIKQAFVMYPVEEVCLKLLLPVLSRVGYEWETGQISLQVEHFTTHMIRQQLLALGATMPSPWRPGRVVAGCAPDDWHEMGILMLSLFLRRRGWEVIFLGQAVGLERLIESLEAIKPDVLLLSSGYLDTAVNLMQAGLITLESKGDSIVFAYGGPLFENAPQLAGKLPGMFAGPTLLQARDRIDAVLSGSWNPEPYLPPALPQALMDVYNAMKPIMLTLTDGMSGLLMDADPDMDDETATQTARHIIGALIAAVRFNMPELQNTHANAARHTLAKLQVPRPQFEELARYYIGPDHLPTLTPFIDAAYAP